MLPRPFIWEYSPFGQNQHRIPAKRYNGTAPNATLKVGQTLQWNCAKCYYVAQNLYLRSSLHASYTLQGCQARFIVRA